MANPNIIKWGLLAPLVLLMTISCQAKEKIRAPEVITSNTKAVTSQPITISLDQGRKAYLSNCISCHNKDPNLKGSLGPEVTNVPIEVFKHKILTGKYPDQFPAGFKPRRNSKVMRPIPRVEKDIEAIHHWIKSMTVK